MMLFEQHPYFVSADLALQDTGALAAAGYGRTAAGRCISAGAPPRPLTRVRFRF